MLSRGLIGWTPGGDGLRSAFSGAGGARQPVRFSGRPHYGDGQRKAAPGRCQELIAFDAQASLQ